MNVNGSSIQSPPKPNPEFVLGVDISKFSFAFNEHTRFVRQIFRQAGYALEPNKVLENEEMVLDIQNAMKKRDGRLQKDKELLDDTWQIVKESVRQLKHDHKRNVMWRSFRAAQSTNTNSSQSQAGNINASSDVVIQRDENNI